MTNGENFERFFLISLDRIDDTQRKLVQAQVSQNAISWWHQQSNVWIVQGGENVGYWRDLLKAFVTGVPGDLYVFNMADTGRRNFASFGPKEHTAWLKSTYGAQTVPRPELEP